MKISPTAAPTDSSALPEAVPTPSITELTGSALGEDLRDSGPTGSGPRGPGLPAGAGQSPEVVVAALLQAPPGDPVTVEPVPLRGAISQGGKLDTPTGGEALPVGGMTVEGRSALDVLPAEMWDRVIYHLFPVTGARTDIAEARQSLGPRWGTSSLLRALVRDGQP